MPTFMLMYPRFLFSKTFNDYNSKNALKPVTLTNFGCGKYIAHHIVRGTIEAHYYSCVIVLCTVNM